MCNSRNLFYFKTVTLLIFITVYKFTFAIFFLRYILDRVCEDFGVVASLDPKPMPGMCVEIPSLVVYLLSLSLLFGFNSTMKS